MHAIETRQLTRRFGRTEAVHDLSLEVPAGSMCALLGANGAGKTTTIKVLMNLLAPTAGSARVLGVDSRRLGSKERAQIGYVSENQRLPLWMTVRELLDYCRPFYPTWDRALEQSLLAQFALPAERRLKHLSRGMLMKAALVTALAYRPKLLVLDEPFSGLDALVREELVHGLLEAAAQGEWSVLVSTHDIEEVERLCDRVALLEAGRLRLCEATESLLRRHRRVEATVAASAAGIERASHWSEVEQAGTLVRFIDSQFDAERSEIDWQRRFAGRPVNARAMSLREIFVTLTRASRDASLKGAAA